MITRAQKQLIDFRVITFSAICTGLAADLMDDLQRKKYKHAAKRWAGLLNKDADNFGALTYSNTQAGKEHLFESVEDYLEKQMPGAEVKAAAIVKMHKARFIEHKTYEITANYARNFLESLGKSANDFEIIGLIETCKTGE